MNLSLRLPSLRFQRLRRSAGVSLISAIFLVVVLAALAVAIASISTSQQSSSVLDARGARAYQAARAGIEWGLYRGLRTPVGSCNGSFAMPLDEKHTLSDFTVTVSCVSVNVSDHKFTVLKAIACNKPTAAGTCPNQSDNPDYVQRILEARF